MTLKQITAINNAMSSLTVLDKIAEEHTPQECYEYVERHTKQLKDANVSAEICEHYKTIAELILDEHFL